MIAKRILPEKSNGNPASKESSKLSSRVESPVTAFYLSHHLPTSQRSIARATSGENTKMSWNAAPPFDTPDQSLVGGSVQSPQQNLPAISPSLQNYPTSSRQGSTAEDLPGRKRKRSYDEDGGETGGGDGLMQDSPSSASKGKHQPGVKRACNDCRQQKVSSKQNDRVKVVKVES